MRLSQSYKSPNISGSDGEQTEGKKEEEGGGLRRLTQAPVVLKHKGEEWGWDSPLRAPIPLQTRLRPRREVERRNRRETGSKMAAGGLFGK